MIKEMFAKYKRLEKCFFKADKAKDMIAYYKTRQQFRTMLCLSAIAVVSAIYMLLAHQVFLVIGPILLLGVLVGFRARAYHTVRFLFFILMMVVPVKYPSSPLVLLTPVVIFITSVQILVQTQSDYLTWIFMAAQAFGFHFYGMERISATIRRMSADELVESARLALQVTFVWSIMTLCCMKILYSQFWSLLRKVNALKDNISKANNQLNAQNLKLQSNLEMKDVFIYTFSHELKNALNGLLGNLYLAYDSAKIPQVIQYLSSAKVCGEVLKNFIHNILDSGKLEKGNLEVSPERKDVMSFMQNAWTICGRIIQNKRLKGLLEIEKNVPAFLDLDEQRMIQIILNLVSNAVKFTEKGYVRIHVSWQTIVASSRRQHEAKESLAVNHSKDRIDEDKEEGREAGHFEDMREFLSTLEASPSKKESHHLVTEYQKKFINGSQFYELNLIKSHWSPEEMLSFTLPEGSKGTLKIQVLDSGCGMATEQQEKLFQKFSQVSSIEGQRKVGTGLGLWICKELANRLNGDIKTRSMVGVGSIFELTIRARVARSPKKPHKNSISLTQLGDFTSPARATFEQRSVTTRKILIADDDSFNIELLKNYLNKFGINYIFAYDGEEAVSLFKKNYNEIGFVITDNFMPKKTGTEAALEIAAFLEEKRQPKIPIMCISGDLKVTIDENGITSVIQKPINFDRLKEELMAVYPQLTQLTYEGDR